MTKGLPHVVILGAGPAGVGAAYQLVSKGLARVTVLEAQDRVGGNASSFELDGVFCDHGSHRLHPVAEPEIMADLKKLLGDAGQVDWLSVEANGAADGRAEELCAERGRRYGEEGIHAQ